MLITLSKGERVQIQFQDSDGEIEVGFDPGRIYVKSDWEDSTGRSGVVYEEKFGSIFVHLRINNGILDSIKITESGDEIPRSDFEEVNPAKTWQCFYRPDYSYFIIMDNIYSNDLQVAVDTGRVPEWLQDKIDAFGSQFVV